MFRPGHPRSRGEQWSTERARSAADGSPPLARGAGAGPIGETHDRRVTPARAGSSSPSRPPGHRPPGHPRSRGEQDSARPPGSTNPGSPPLARGAAAGRAARISRRRVTPARAGSSPSRRRHPRTRPGHPRSRGEQANPRNANKHGQGSPPLARGADRHRRPRAARPRVTPARAGSRWRWRPGHRGRSGHPRSRGEQVGKYDDSTTINGSPPLARGAVLRDEQVRQRPRVTPARAGSSRPGTWVPSRSPGHPRSRGEQTLLLNGDADQDGSPPLARGADFLTCSVRRALPFLDRSGSSAPDHDVRGSSSPAACLAHLRSRGEDARCTPD
jgi:hypothetical protein